MESVAQPTSVAQRIRRWEVLPYWLVLPTLAYLALFFGWPMVEAFTLAFREDGVWSLTAFERMRDDLRFEEAFKNTLILIAVIIPVQFALALAMALLVNTSLKGRGIFLYIFLLPLAISDLAAGIVWSAIFTERGLPEHDPQPPRPRPTRRSRASGSTRPTRGRCSPRSWSPRSGARRR